MLKEDKSIYWMMKDRRRQKPWKQRKDTIVLYLVVIKASRQGRSKIIVQLNFITDLRYYSGHLARHHRIHTGEKNFPCLYPGCPSRFSRQDNMMQHYRTHVSNRSRLHYYYHCHQYPYQHYNNTLSWDNNSNDEPVVYNNRREWSIFSSSSTDSSSSSSSNSHVSMNASPTYSNTEYQPTLPPIKPNLTWVHQDHSYHDTMKSKRFYFEGYA